MKTYWTDEQFVEAVTKSVSVSEVLKCFGLPETQPFYRKVFFESVYKLGLDLDHFTVVYSKKEIEEKALKKYRTSNTHKIKRRLIASGVPKACSVCKCVDWQGKPLSFEVDHIDGDNTNNELNNLRLLCPNCHSQTDTFRGKNVKSYNPRMNPSTTKYKCPKCLTRAKTKKAVHCLVCSRELSRKPYVRVGDSAFKIKWPSNQELVERINSSSKIAVARELGVSFAGLKKHMKKYGPL